MGRTAPGTLGARRAALLAFAAALLGAAAACGGSSPAPTANSSPSPAPGALTTISFTTSAGAAQLRVEIAATETDRERGLMFRDSLPADQGMLFVFPADTSTPFWMRDTKVPLSIAFISAAGTVVDIQDMQPLDQTLHRSAQPYRYAVEANQGWFASHGVGVGATVVLPSASAS